MKFASISLNFDSLAEAYRYPAGYADASFTTIADRFLALAARHGVVYTIFVIGRDLENPENRAIVREWARAGHEIANHSWSHSTGFGSMSRALIRDEILRCHDRIAEAAGTEPHGFTAPGWMASRFLLETLVELGYEYDASTVPSWLMFPAVAKMLMNHLGDPRFFGIARRRDYGIFVAGSRAPFLTSGSLFPGIAKAPNAQSEDVVTLPLPTNRWRVACWHTLAFMLGADTHGRLLNSCLKDVESFYYVVHPADLADIRDFDSGQRMRLERADVSLGRKSELMEAAFRLIRGAGRSIVTMRELARQARVSAAQPA